MAAERCELRAAAAWQFCATSTHASAFLVEIPLL
jgi:hypothetical protein